MGRWSAVFLTLLSGALTVLIVWMANESEGSDRMFAIGGALFFGAGIPVGLSHLIPARIPPADIDGSVTIPNSQIRSLVMAATLIMITAAALIMWPAFAGDNDWRKYVFLLIPVPCAFLALKYLQWALGGRPAYRFDKHGVTRYQWGERTIPWDAVTNVRVVKVRSTKSVVLDVTPDFRRQASAWSRFSATTGFGDVSLASGASGLTPDDIETLVRRFWRPRT
jgi:hypothetical protein